MKTTIITVITAILGALGTAAAAKWALPPEHITAIVTAITSIVGAAFGIYSALHQPKPSGK
jgi:disulfide bond formation protein DsbB